MSSRIARKRMSSRIARKRYIARLIEGVGHVRWDFDPDLPPIFGDLFCAAF